MLIITVLTLPPNLTTAYCKEINTLRWIGHDTYYGMIVVITNALIRYEYKGIEDVNNAGEYKRTTNGNVVVLTTHDNLTRWVIVTTIRKMMRGWWIDDEKGKDGMHDCCRGCRILRSNSKSDSRRVRVRKWSDERISHYELEHYFHFRCIKTDNRRSFRR